ncbi:MAG TPA: class I SAM-dependent methyltransferase [Candidatus Limnocylindria bacterium]|nr:class I SAM-dependent methyltransferase [Candidatus Limnocylindria bacterium]
MAQKKVALDPVAAHNQRMWDRLAGAAIPYTRPRGTPPRDRAGKRRFLDRLTNGRIGGLDLRGRRVLSLAGGGGWEPILFAELGADTTLFDISAKQLETVRALAASRGTALRLVQGDMRDLSAFRRGSFDLVVHCHSLVFVPDAGRVIAEVARVLAPGGTYVASTMHPITLRMYETWTGTGWNLKRGYFDDGPMPYDDATWEFGRTRVEARTLEYGHRISDLINACAAGGMVVDGFWEWTPDWAKGGAKPKPGTDEALERDLPTFIELRARKPPLASSGGRRPRAGARRGRAAATRSRTASRRR